MTTGPAAEGDNAAGDEHLPIPEVEQPQIGDPISDAELDDLNAIASQQGTSLQAAIDRYGWNDNFALAVSTVREAASDAFVGAEIVDGGHAWIAFAAGAPERALDIIDVFTSSHPSVTVEVRTDLGFTELEIEEAIATIHYALIDAVEVRDASTSFDYSTRQITVAVSLDSGVADSVLNDLRAGAIETLIDSGLGGILDSISVSVVRLD